MDEKNDFRFRLKPNLLFALQIKPTSQGHVIRESTASRNTVRRMLTDTAPEITRLELDKFANVFVKGLGYDTDDFMNLRLCDLFTLKWE